MCTDVRVASWLNSHGHDATHLRAEGLQRLPNGEIFDKAVAESRVVVTFDLDFGEIVALAKGRKTGVILFRLQNTRTSFVIQRLSRKLPNGNMASGGSMFKVQCSKINNHRRSRRSSHSKAHAVQRFMFNVQ